MKIKSDRFMNNESSDDSGTGIDCGEIKPNSFNNKNQNNLKKIKDRKAFFSLKTGSNLVKKEISDAYEQDRDNSVNQYAVSKIETSARTNISPFLMKDAQSDSGRSFDKRKKLNKIISDFISLITRIGIILVSSGAGLLVIICLLGMLITSSFGIFFASEDTSGDNLKDVIRYINMSFYDKIDSKASEISADDYEIRGVRSSWKDVLCIYSVMEDDGAMLLDDIKVNKIEKIFNYMNEVSYSEEIRKSDDSEEEEKILVVTISSKSLEDTALNFGFDNNQVKLINELTIPSFDNAWNRLLYGIYDGDSLVEVALSQLGNIGGEPYWSWYGYSERVEWCACFVSWCAEQCGLIESEAIPKFSGVVYGVDWFKERGKFIPRTEKPEPGLIIFFDWDMAKTNGQDEVPDHVGIVESVSDGMIYTVEGNSGDSCRINAYPIGHYEIYGYGDAGIRSGKEKGTE